MLIRIVKMSFQETKIDEFKKFSQSIYPTIRNYPGCLHLNFMQDLYQPQIFFTYSKWDSEDNLNRYRESDFFKQTWSAAKKWFAAKPEAWSVKNL